MKLSNVSVVPALAAVALVAVALYVRQSGGLRGTAENIGAAVIDAADGVLSGGVFAVGDRIGVPDTREQSVIDKGRAELAAGDYWNASFHLPAGEFISGAWNRLTN